MKTLTICGSMRYEKEMMQISYMLEAKCGFNVLQCVYAPEGAAPTQKEAKLLAEGHFRKIDLSDGIYVVDINNYVGESVKAEIAYAKDKGKEVLYHSEFMNQFPFEQERIHHD